MIWRRFHLRLCLGYIRNVLLFAIITLVVFVYQGKEFHKGEVAASIPKNALKYIMFKNNISVSVKDKNTLRKLADEYNTEQIILNVDTFGAITTDTPVLVIYVHEFSIYLKFTLVSLSQVKGIEGVLIVFSHSFFDENINNLISSIDFCRVLQIFYPYSVQIYSNEFPGFQSSDCAYNMDIKTAESLNCTGAWNPDIHGNYRHPRLTELKHRWWWTTNKVFEGLKCMENHDGLVIFLNDDFVFMEDFLYMALYMKTVAGTLNQCEFISLGISPLITLDESYTYRVEVSTWDPKYHSSVIGFDSSVWKSISLHYDLFCYIDDYSWSRSLYYVSLNRKDGKRYRTMSSMLPRAFKTSSCGLYGHILDCDVIESVYQVIDLEKRNNHSLFPPHLEVYTQIELEDDEDIIFDYIDGNGGWGDLRDRQLCINITTSKETKGFTI